MAVADHAAKRRDGAPLRVRAPQAALRREPSDGAALDTEALCGELVSVLAPDEGEWVRVRLHDDGYEGWMRRDGLAEAGSEPTHRVAAVRTFVFSRPDIKSPPLEGLSLSARVTVSGEAEDHNARYALIEPAGAIVMQHLAPLGSLESDWVGVAEKFLGVPYLWGGKTSLGLDCSGLVQLSLNGCGIAAPRDTGDQQRAVGKAVPISGGLPVLRRGDFVFWKGHVGMMSDEKTLLHANAHHMAVAAEPLSEALTRIRARGLDVTGVRRIHQTS